VAFSSEVIWAIGLVVVIVEEYWAGVFAATLTFSQGIRLVLKLAAKVEISSASIAN
jgi:hypothetical protein